MFCSGAEGMGAAEHGAGCDKEPDGRRGVPLLCGLERDLKPDPDQCILPGSASCHVSIA